MIVLFFPLTILMTVSQAVTSFATAKPVFASTLLQQNGNNFTETFVTALAFAPTQPDLLLIGTGLGVLKLLRVKRAGLQYTVTAVHSETTVGAGRTILGISANPFSPLTFYVSSSALQWRMQGFTESGWQNGRIERVILDESGPSLVVDDKPFISGLPVSLSLGQQAVFGSAVNPRTGRLWVSIGTFNNGGAESPMEGNLPDCLLSATMLDVDVTSSSVTRSVRWSSSNSATAELVDGPDVTGVKLFATGLRSSFQIALSRNGKPWVVDGGANEPFGPVSISCNESMPYERSQPDNVIPLRKGRWYGHGNRRRAGECKTVLRRIPPSRAKLLFPGYTPPLFNNDQATEEGIIGTGTVGLGFYEANLFPRFRGKLLGADADNIESSDITDRLPPGLNIFDLRAKRVTRLVETPGITLDVDVLGAIFLSQPQRNSIGIAIPKSGMRRRPGIRNIFPRRGLPGSRVFILSTGIKRLFPSIKIGKVRCSNVRPALGGKVLSCVVGTPRKYGKLEDVSVLRFRLKKSFTVLDPKIAL